MGLVFYSSGFIPPEWIDAHGLEPRFLVPSRAEAGSGPVQPLEGVCPFMRKSVNAALTLAGQEDVAGLILTTLCDQMRHAKDILDGQDRLPSFLFNVPSTWQQTSSHALYRAELRRLGRFLESVGGRGPSPTHLVEVMEAYDVNRAAGADPCRGAVPVATPSHTGKPVALLGGPLTREDRDVYDLITEAGGCIVLDGVEGGERTRPARFDRRRFREDPLEELAGAYFGQLPDVAQRPNTLLFLWLAREVAARHVRGVILARQVWCDKWHAEVHRLRDFLKVPLLDVDLDGEPCNGRTRTRIQAFMESLP